MDLFVFKDELACFGMFLQGIVVDLDEIKELNKLFLDDLLVTMRHNEVDLFAI